MNEPRGWLYRRDIPLDQMSMTNSEVPKSEPNDNAAQPHKWPGHMADDVASTFGPDPHATLAATPDELILTSTRGNFRLPRVAVTKLGRGNFYPWLFSAVRIHHNVPGYPSALQFKPLGTKPNDVRIQLRALGYPA